MLVNNVNGEPVSASMVRDSSFYIEVAKFVQAYTIVINYPNEFLEEIGDLIINEKEGKITWEQLSRIMQVCDFGFENKPTDTDLKVYYNYALQIGTLDPLSPKLATVGDVAEAQKHYYNFVDQAKDRAESSYLKQHKVFLSRESEMKNADGELSKLEAGTWFAFMMMMFSTVIAIFGFVSLFIENSIVLLIGKIIPVWNPQYIGALILIFIGLLSFYLFDKMYVYFNKKHFKLKKATQTIFDRGIKSYAIEIYLKRKLDTLTRQLKIVQGELSDKTKNFDVQENINRLKFTNRYYQKYVQNEESVSLETESLSTGDQMSIRPEEFAPVTLTKEQEENLRRVNKEVIILEGQFDEEAYKEKFEKSRLSNEDEKENVSIEDSAHKQDQFEQKQQNDLVKEEKQQIEEEQDEEKLKQQEKELIESIDYIKEILGLSSDEELEKNK